MISILGHLALVAVMVTSVVVMIDRARLVAPDRVQIMEIDLSMVKITGDETRLYNTNVDDVPTPEPAPETKPDEPAPQPEPEKQSAPEPEAQPEPIESPSLVEDVPEEPKPEPEKQPEPEVKKEVVSPENREVPDVPAPRKKTVVRVNREVLSLDRTLTISVVDALRVAMTRCWTIDTNRSDIADIRAVAHLTMRKNGTVRDVWFESAARAETDPAFAYVLETIRSAIDVCQPFRMLPPGEFAKWEKIKLTFYPTQGKVM